MKVDKRLVPLKAHYFCFLGCVSPIFPFLIVLGVQLGIPVSVTGTLSAVSLLLVVFTKPIVATLADAFPSFRRLIFIATLFVMVACFSSIYFVTPMREVLRVEGQMVKAAAVVVGGGNRDEGRNSLHKDVYTARSAGTSGRSPSVVTLAGEDVAGDQLVLLARGEADDCYVGVAWDCVVSCRRQPGACVLPSTTTSNTTSNTTTTQPVINLKALDGDQGLQMLQGIRETLDAHYTLEGGLFEGLPAMGDVLLEEDDSARRRVYKLEGFKGPWDSLVTNVSVECQGGQWAGSGCPGAWSYWAFWTFAILLCIGQCAFNTAASITDAIIVDIIGEDGDYGLQRAWGTVGWGLMGPVSGLLIDWWSGTAVTKNYSPAFLLCFLLGTTDVILSTSCIKVPQIKTDHNILKKVWPVLRQPKVFIFCCFVIMNGIFDGVVASFIFIMQEDMARGTSAMAYMTFIQGFTLFVQCGVEAPCMFVNKWFLRKLGPHYLTSFVFFLYIIRLLGLAAVGAYGPVWATLLVEILNGPCYGLGYTAIVMYGARIAPPGTSTTIQSVVNLFYESIGYGIAFSVGGLLYSRVGGPKLYMIAGLTAAVTFLLHVLSVRFLPRGGEAESSQPSTGKEDGKTPTGKEDGSASTGKEDGSTSTGKEDGRTPTGGKEDGRIPTGGKEDDRTPTGRKEDGRTSTVKEDGRTSTGKEDGRTPTRKEDGRTSTGKEDSRTSTGKGDGRTPTGGKEDGRTPTGKEDGKTPTGGKEDGRTPTGKEDGKTSTGGKEDSRTSTGKEDGRTPTGGKEDGRTSTGGKEDGRTPTGEKEDGRTSTVKEDSRTPTVKEDGRTPTVKEDGRTSTVKEDGRTPTGEKEDRKVDTVLSSQNATARDGGDIAREKTESPEVDNHLLSVTDKDTTGIVLHEIVVR